MVPYFLLEEMAKISGEVWDRVEKMLEFVSDMTLSDGSFPDYGDRDDGFVFRLHGDYAESPFSGMLNVGSFFFNWVDWQRNTRQAEARLAFWSGKGMRAVSDKKSSNRVPRFADEPWLKTYPEV